MMQQWMKGLIAMVLLASSTLLCAGRVELHFNIPAGLESYSGRQPVTFGVPFPADTLRKSDNLRIVDAGGNEQPGQFEITATWTADGSFVRWLLIDTMASVQAGVAQPLWLEFGPDVPAPTMPAMTVRRTSDAVEIDTGARAFTVRADGTGLGRFTLRDGEGRAYDDSRADENSTFEVERHGPVRTVVKRTGRYTDDHGRSIAEFVTRVRYYAGSPFVRVYHTMIWLTDDKTRIGELSFAPEVSGRIAGSGATVGLDGEAVQSSSKPGTSTSPGQVFDLRQSDWNKVVGSSEGRQLDGWLRTSARAGSFTAAVRWPWQQFPMGLGTSPDGAPLIRLIGPVEPMSLMPLDVAVEGVKLNVPAWNLRIFKGGAPGGDMLHNGPAALPHLTPRGVAKTWELLLWYDDNGSAPAPEIVNALAQQPVLGYADPRFAVRAELPSPASPVDDAAFPEVEAALCRAFDFYTRELAEEGDFGVWNYGDLQWTWMGRGVPIYRYWMNLGKGWSIVPWSLWLRSGDRRYWDNGEANSRHAMDVDMCHVPGWGLDPSDYRRRGGQYHYSALHWGYGPEVFTYYVDSEFLPYCWYMSGYERARDVMHEHAEAMARWENRADWMNHFRGDLRVRAGRHLYVMLKNICVLYEATWDPRLKAMADEVLELMLAAQFDSGNFPHVKTNHYLDQPLNIAVRVYGFDRVGPALRRWHAVLGDPLRPSAGGGMGGPMSLWSAVTLWRQDGDAHLLDAAARLMRTQAATVDDSDTIWRGMNSIPGHEAGPALRDWPIVMAALKAADPPVKSAGFMPMAGFNSRLDPPREMAADGWALRHVAMTLNEGESPFAITIRWLDRPTYVRIRVLAPDNSVAAVHEGELPTHTLSEDAFRTVLKVPTPVQRGAYAIIVDGKGTRGFGASIGISSDTGKLVHYMPDGWRNFNAPQHAGEFWAMPLPGKEASIDWAQGDGPRGRHVLLDASGRVLAATRVSGSVAYRHPANPPTYAFALPQADQLRFRADDDTGLCRVILTNEGKWNRWFGLSGFSPFIASTADQWFDALLHPHCDFSEFQ